MILSLKYKEEVIMVLLESGENYLETILILQQRNGNVRSIDIATEMNFSKPSVSRAMSILKKSGYIIMEPDGRIVLTENGLKKAASVLDRHKTLTVFLTDILNVPRTPRKRTPAASNTSSVRSPLRALKKW